MVENQNTARKEVIENLESLGGQNLKTRQDADFHLGEKIEELVKIYGEEVREIYYQEIDNLLAKQRKGLAISDYDDEFSEIREQLKNILLTQKLPEKDIKNITIEFIDRLEGAISLSDELVAKGGSLVPPSDDIPLWDKQKMTAIEFLKQTYAPYLKEDYETLTMPWLRKHDRKLYQVIQKSIENDNSKLENIILPLNQQDLIDNEYETYKDFFPRDLLKEIQNASWLIKRRIKTKPSLIEKAELSVKEKLDKLLTNEAIFIGLKDRLIYFLLAEIYEAKQSKEIESTMQLPKRITKWKSGKGKTVVEFFLEKYGKYIEAGILTDEWLKAKDVKLRNNIAIEAKRGNPGLKNIKLPPTKHEIAEKNAMKFLELFGKDFIFQIENLLSNKDRKSNNFQKLEI